jgi:putative transposase
VQRGNNREPLFFAESDCRAYLNWLKEAADRYGCDVHAYVLMTNHVHLLMSPREKESVSRALQYVRRRHVPFVNHLYGRTGTLWEGRFKASLVQEQCYVMACYRYIEMNPVRAGMTTLLGDYRWSSHRANAYGENDELVVPQDQFTSLAPTLQQRQEVYRKFFESSRAPEPLMNVRRCVQTGTPLDNDRFLEQIEAVLKVKVGRSRRGRLRRVVDA